MCFDLSDPVGFRYGEEEAMEQPVIIEAAINAADLQAGESQRPPIGR